MRLPIGMRVRDWLADHFGFQYAVPRMQARQPSRWWGYGAGFLRATLKLALGAFVFGIWLIKALQVKRGEVPVALLFLAALLALLSGIQVCLLI